ncbi:MAG: hypothetical protein DHS20C17_29860 [Cyclobacteriaceae bacterium]|nr:MAG: hypothetical protein DHS20C17_29860 [Cyclobacteriaceae bacterium]
MITFLATNGQLFSQVGIPPTFNQALMLSSDDELENVEGTPYLYEEFKPGDIYYGGEHKIEQIPLRLDIFHDRLEYKDEKGAVMAFGNPEMMDYVKIGKEVFIYLPKNPSYKISGFLKMWNTRMPCLLSRMNVNYLKGEEAKPYDLHPGRPDRLERVQDIQYVMRSRNDVEKVSSIKKLIKYLGAHEAELSEYAETADLSPKEPEKLVKLVNYYHQLEQRQ